MSDLAKIEEIYHAALAVESERRRDFVRQRCAGDLHLQSEVESFLALAEKAESFIESLPGDLAAAFIENKDDDENLIGCRFGHFHVVSLLGAGGMGRVYLAEDTRLGRKIALKLLPSQLSANPERKRRFEQEARAASSLNHPNIITIHGFEEFENFNFIATEFIDGGTLRERLQKSALSVGDALDIGVQLASALAAAHAVGVVHRDIKPANVMLRCDGIAKILDFGLAKLTAAGSGSFDTLDLTGQRRVMGTINYMSPEQALGERLDARTDIFSLGVVLYEMLSGVQPFAGHSEAAVYNRIINKDAAPLSDIKPDVPIDLAEIVSRAMRKDADERFQTAAEMRLALETVRQRLNTGEARAAGSQPVKAKAAFSRNKLVAFAAAVVVVIFLTTGLLFFNQSPSGAKPLKNVNYAQLTKLGGAEMYPSLSPDGKMFLYSSRAGGNWDIFYQRVGGMNAINLTKDSPANDLHAAYSPDGEQIAFRSDRDGGGIFLMGATGENVRRLTDAGFYPSWSPDGREIVFTTENFEEPMNRSIFGKLWIVNVATGERRKIFDAGDAMQPAWSPSGARIAFWGYKQGGQRDLWTISADGKNLEPVTDDAAVDWNPVWSPDGKFLYFVSDRGGSMNLWRIQIDERTGKVSGSPETIATPSIYTQHLTFSRNGRNFAYVQAVNYATVWKADFESSNGKTAIKNPIEITQGAMLATNPEPSPDGEWIVFDSHGAQQEDLFIVKTDGTGLRQLTNDSFKDRAPRWSPDGKQIAFFSDRLGKYTGWVINADGSNLRQVTKLVEEKWAQLPVWSPGGDKLIFNRSFSPPGIFDTSANFLSQTPHILEAENPPARWVMMSGWSPDGKKLAGYMVSSGSGEAGVFTYSFDTRRYEKMSDSGVFPVWLGDSRRLLFYQREKIFLLDTETRKAEEILSAAPHRVQRVTVSKDNRTIYHVVQKTESDIWLGSLE